MRALVIGQGGIGQLYKRVFRDLDYDVVTIDCHAPADYTEFTPALGSFDISVIATPNFTHESIARTVADSSDIVLVEKPGVISADAWSQLHLDYPHTRFMMVKNNQWRDNIQQLKALAKESLSINILWLNKNRIPNPGSHFTTKKLSYGGVSRDLMPHLLSFYTVLSEDYLDIDTYSSQSKQQHQLADITSTDYGVIDPQGTYDVDDVATILIDSYKFPLERKSWMLKADWANGHEDCLRIEFDDEIVNFGLCPESAYKAMILDCVKHLQYDTWWYNHFKQDLWIHNKMEQL